MNGSGRDVYIVDGCRTPFLKAKNKPNEFTSSDLAVQAGRELLLRQSFEPNDLEEVIIGNTIANPKEANIARVISIRLGCGPAVTAFSVQRNCASGLQALDNAYQDIKMGRHDLILAGGTDAMSHAPLLFNQKMAIWLGQWFSAKTTISRFKTLFKFRPNYLIPIIGLLQGLKDHTVGLSMGATAENLAYLFNISRSEMDAFSVQSHQRLIKAKESGFLDEIISIYDTKGHDYQEDDGVRSDTSVEKLAKLKPFFDKKYGHVTPGNSSQVTDGAALLILASEKAVEQYKLPILGRVIDTEWAGVDPAQMGLGPAHAVPPILKRQQIAFNDIDYWEINEAFAAQVLACLNVWEDPDYCKEHFNWEGAFGKMPMDKLNVDGGAIAVGHPVGASGARLVLHLLNVLKRTKKRYGIATLCIGGGQGGAMLVENV